MALKWWDDNADEFKRKLDELSYSQLSDIRKMLEDARDSLVQELSVINGKFTSEYLEGMLTRIDRDLKTINNRIKSIILGGLGDGAAEGAAATDKIVSRFNIPIIAAGRPIDVLQLQVLADYTVDLIKTGVTEPLLADIRNIVRRGYLIGRTGFDMMQELAGKKDLDPLRLKNKFFRAERIIRTETGNIASRVARERALKYAEGDDEVWHHKWRSAEDERVRPTHAIANDAKPIPTDQPFIIGGFKAFRPHDENLPAKESVNCRCVVLTIPPGAELK